MAILTDPARELYELAKHVGPNSGEPGATHLARCFGVDQWSTEFLHLLYCISERVDLVVSILRASTTDADLYEAAAEDLVRFRGAFVGSHLSSKWNDASNGGGEIVRTFGERIRPLSFEVRRSASYPALTDEEAIELEGLIRDYLEEISDDNDIPDFAKVAVIHGLEAFVFQLTKLRWASAQYSLAAFRELRRIYEALQSEVEQCGGLHSGDWLTGFGEVLTWFKFKVESVKSYTDAAIYLGAGYNFAAPALDLPTLQLPSPEK